jgi:hypothetical protein
MRMDILTCGRCDAPIYRDREKKGCDRCGRISKTMLYERDIILERNELARIINNALRAEIKMSILMTRPSA